MTLGDQTYQLDRPFLVLATQNPVEQEGTYPLPEAQVDRFMLKLKIGYPSREEEREIMRRAATPLQEPLALSSPRGYPECAPACRSDLHGSQSRESILSTRLRDPRARSA